MSLRKISLMLVVLALFAANLGAALVEQVPTRDQIANKYKWDLTGFFASDSAWQIAFDQLKGRIPEMAKFETKLGESGDILAQCLMLNDTLIMQAQKLFVYSMLKLDEDTELQATAGLERTTVSPPLRKAAALW